MPSVPSMPTLTGVPTVSVVPGGRLMAGVGVVAGVPMVAMVGGVHCGGHLVPFMGHLPGVVTAVAVMGRRGAAVLVTGVSRVIVLVAAESRMLVVYVLAAVAVVLTAHNSDPLSKDRYPTGVYPLSVTVALSAIFRNRIGWKIAGVGR